MEYSIDQHIHNYSIWTAARAVQRGFKAKTPQVMKAIEESGLREFAETSKQYDKESFEKFHRLCANKMIKSFGSTGLDCHYGAAAKIIAIYLKTSVIVRTNGSDGKCLIIHSPIDRILLNSLGIRNINWSQLSEVEYWNLISDLTSKYETVNWKLEEKWQPWQESNTEID